MKIRDESENAREKAERARYESLRGMYGGKDHPPLLSHLPAPSPDAIKAVKGSFLEDWVDIRLVTQEEYLEAELDAERQRRIAAEAMLDELRSKRRRRWSGDLGAGF